METLVNYDNIRYGMLVEVLRPNGYHAGCKVHFYNRKGVLIGNYYEFVPYDTLRMRTPKNRQYQAFFYGERLSRLKSILFMIPLKAVDILIRFTQKHMD